MTEVYCPGSLDEAIEMLGAHADCQLLAGGTDLMVARARSEPSGAPVIDLLGIPQLRGIKQVAPGWRIGATTTFGEIRRSRRIRQVFPALADAAAQIGAWQIQNRATLGGNMATASPAGDSLPVLTALGATVVVSGPNGFRELPHERFYLGYRRTALEPDEVIAWVILPEPRQPSVQHFRKVTARGAQAISKVIVAMVAQKTDGRLRHVRFAAGSVAPTPVRLPAAEKACEGARPNTFTADLAAAAAMGEVRPIDDVRSTAAYRRFVLGRIVRRMVLQSAGS